jgi:hypothetical protein
VIRRDESNREKRYYVLFGKLLDSYNAHIEKQREAVKTWRAWAESHGGSELFLLSGFTHHVGGIIGDPAKIDATIWEQVTKEYGGVSHTFFRPRNRSKAQKALRREMEKMQFSFWTPEGFKDVYHGGYCYHATWERIGEAVVLHVPSVSDYVPEGCQQLKTSEYWAMKESATTSKGGA